MFAIMASMRKKFLITSLIVTVFFAFLYVSHQSHSIYGGDSGDLVSAAYTGGIAHPPGYPLYTAIGHILTKVVSYGTPAWQITLLSSLSLTAAMGVLTLYSLLTYRSVLPSIIGVASLGLTYIYWLYASVPEVFGLHILFLTLQLLTLKMWEITYHQKWLLFFVFLFVVSVFHHQIILFMVPAYLYFFIQHEKKAVSFVQSARIKIIAISAIALIPLLYFAISIPNLAGYTWEDTLSLSNVIKIITRSTYGSFTSALIILEKPLSRLTDVYAYFVFLVEDFGPMGAVLALVGAASDFIRRRRLFNFHSLIFFCTGPLFFFLWCLYFEQ
ncbi:MAG: hypothetical protein UZ22_OP11002000709 [Microgenomates bacterium OLB23]|nr:MAG: hypothetical protein UZ22_OP11002000709 [Microgenomates bacterium OLB23]